MTAVFCRLFGGFYILPLSLHAGPLQGVGDILHLSFLFRSCSYIDVNISGENTV